MLGQEKFGFNAFWWERLWDEESIFKVAQTLKEIGYRAVEWKETSFNPHSDYETELKRAVRVTRKVGLEVSDFVILRDPIDPQKRENNIKDVVEFIRASAKAGVNKVNTSTGGKPEKLSTQKAWDNLFFAFEEFVRVAEKERVCLVVEPVVGCLCHDFFTGEILLKKISSPWLCLTFDPSHYLLYRNDIGWVIRQWKEKIKHVHIKDAVGVPGKFGVDFLFPLLGEGGVNWNEVFQALEEINYDGWLSVEFESFGFMEKVLKNDFAQAARWSMKSLKALWENYRG